MNLKQAMLITPCRWGYYGLEDIGIKLKPHYVHELINILSMPSIHFTEKFCLEKFYELPNSLTELQFNMLLSDRLNALQCLVEYFIAIERNLERDVSDLPLGAIVHLRENGLL